MIGRNIVKRKIPRQKVLPVEATFEKINTETGDLSTFTGTVEMLDYMAQEPIKLNFSVHVKHCPANDDTFAFFEVSPQQKTHPVWQTLDGIWAEFRCDVK